MARPTKKRNYGQERKQMQLNLNYVPLAKEGAEQLTLRLRTDAVCFHQTGNSLVLQQIAKDPTWSKYPT